MACIEKIYSVSALIGGSACNGNCVFCAATDLRPEAQEDNPIFWKNFESAIKLSARYGGWSLSLTSSGEPTLYPESVTKALETYSKLNQQGYGFPNVNLFTNGIRLGDDKFCEMWLPTWRKLGLTNIAVSVHHPMRWRQSQAYGLPLSKYPEFAKIFQNIDDAGLGVRCTLLLRKGAIDDPTSYSWALGKLISEYDIAGLKHANITSWPVGNPDNTRNEFTPSRLNLLRIRWWLRRNARLCHGHVWGGGVYDFGGHIVRITDYVTPHDPDLDYVRQLVVFQDGTVAYSWIREGALCMV